MDYLMKHVDNESLEMKYLVFYGETVSKLRSDELLNLKHLTQPLISNTI